VAVAEGVENKDLYERMLAFDFDVLQGYYLARPLTETDLMAMVKDEAALDSPLHLTADPAPTGQSGP
jgi:EAL domain-containing protein (putative c-di-GMP-specific phosphodiesterase class I)